MGMKGRWFRRRPSDEEMREELEAHVAMRAEHDGVDEAAARRRLGNRLQTREAMRRVWIAEWWDALGQDIRFTARSWRRQPGFALGALLVLALGLGASTALFAALDRVLFRPLPYANADGLVSVGWVTVPPRFEEFQAESMFDRFYLQEWDTTPAPFQSVTAMSQVSEPTADGTPPVVGSVTCATAGEQPEALRCSLVEHNFLRVLGVRVALGRDFAPEDDVRGTPWVAVISHALWVRRFGADTGVVGRTLSFEGPESVRPVRVIGVLPPDFEMPLQTRPLETADVLLPAQLRPLDPDNPFSTSIMTLARLRPDVTPERARLMLESRWPEGSGQLQPGSRFREEWRVRPLHDRRFGGAVRVAWLLVGAVAAFLLIACVNVTNLMLARIGERHREFGIRAAIGAGRMRLARLALAESLLLACAGGGIGLLVAVALLETFVAMAPPGIPGVADAALDLRVFVVAALLVVVTGTAVGVWPAISVFRVGAQHGLRATAASSPGARPRVRFALVTTQIALTLALLAGSALLLRSLWNVVNVPLGFDAGRVVTLTATLSNIRYPTVAQRTAFFDELIARAGATPGAVSVALSESPPPPLLPQIQLSGFEIEGRQAELDAPRLPIRIRRVTPHYLDTFRIPVVRGRSFQEADLAGEPVVVINESAARRLFAGAPALGGRIRHGLLTPGPPVLPVTGGQPVQPRWYTVVGVTVDVRNRQALTDEPGPEIYLVSRPGIWGARGHLSLRTTASSAEAAVFLRQIAADLDPRQLVTVRTGDELLTTLTAQPRFVTWLLTAFATLALLLAAAGLYSVASYLVTQRRRDIAVRMAVGAAPRDVAGHFVSEAGRWIIGGALLGCGLGWIGTRALQSQLYEVQALDPWSWAAAMLALALALVTAVFRPAYRAAHVDPIAALRAE